MRRGVLRGREHTELGAVAALAEGRCAIALSRGGFRKGYHHRDPNEDVAGFALGREGTLVAVADGHGGCDAAELAVTALLERFAEGWTGSAVLAGAWPEQARRALAILHAELVERGSGGGNPEARTTLAFALARPGEDLLALASVGDSHVFVADASGARDLAHRGGERPVYLGSPSLEPENLVARAVLGAGPLAGAQAIVLATDGLSEEGIGVDAPDAAVLDALAHAASARPALRALEAARGLVEHALASHRRRRAGDNVATAVWLP
jgi:serine/threonine protein phosphatase PrpC